MVCIIQKDGKWVVFANINDEKSVEPTNTPLTSRLAMLLVVQPGVFLIRLDMRSADDVTTSKLTCALPMTSSHPRRLGAEICFDLANTLMARCNLNRVLGNHCMCVVGTDC